MQPRNDRRSWSGGFCAGLPAALNDARNDAGSEVESAGIAAPIIAFARFVRANGLRIGIAEDIDAARVALICGITNEDMLRTALRCLFCKTRDDWQRFDELFDRFWNTKPSAANTTVIKSGGRTSLGAIDEQDAKDARVSESAHRPSDGRGAAQSGASTLESQARRDFRHYTLEAELRALTALVERLARRMRRRVMHRLEISQSGRRLDFRVTIRKSLSYGGMPFKPVFRLHRGRQPKLVLLLDVSGSMNLYSMLFLRFAREIARAFKRVEVFVFHTWLVHITEALAERSLERMKQTLAGVSAGWAGGTKIGASIAELNEHYAARVLCGRPIVIIVSDGLDTGSPEQLAGALQELKRRARRLIWLNPLLGREGYAPSARGMKVALPYLDAFLPAHNLASLEALEPYLVSL
jgi:uncharacterized protein with von Willebrand factor type A (vWA) domain